MRNKYLLLILSLLTLVSTSIVAQSSAYGRYGYGELMTPSFSASKGMGGVGIGIRDGLVVNTQNPASYSDVDSLTFLFDVGVYLRSGEYSAGDGAKSSNLNGNLDYLAMKFRLARNIGMSLGMTSYSRADYSYGFSGEEQGVSYVQQFIGRGGLARVYAGVGATLFDHLSLGVNVGYLFGEPQHINKTSTGGDPIFRSEGIHVNAVQLETGLQGTIPVGRYETLTLGAYFSPDLSFDADYYWIKTVAKDTTLIPEKDRHVVFQQPLSYGFGASYKYKKNLTVAADFLHQGWADTEFVGQTDSLQNRMRFALGAEYCPDPKGRSYVERMKYRLGANYSNSYYNIEGAGTSTYGVSLGFSFPLMDLRSTASLTLEYIRVQPQLKSMITENYFQVSVGYTLNELFFFKRKIE